MERFTPPLLVVTGRAPEDNTGMLAKLAVEGNCPPLGRLTTPMLDSPDTVLGDDVVTGAIYMVICLSTTSNSSWVELDMAVFTESATIPWTTCNTAIPCSVADSTARFVSITIGTNLTHVI